MVHLRTWRDCSLARVRLERCYTSTRRFCESFSPTRVGLSRPCSSVDSGTPGGRDARFAHQRVFFGRKLFALRFVVSLWFVDSGTPGGRNATERASAYFSLISSQYAGRKRNVYFADVSVSRSENSAEENFLLAARPGGQEPQLLPMRTLAALTTKQYTIKAHPSSTSATQID